MTWGVVWSMNINVLWDVIRTCSLARGSVSGQRRTQPCESVRNQRFASDSHSWARHYPVSFPREFLCSVGQGSMNRLSPIPIAFAGPGAIPTLWMVFQDAEVQQWSTSAPSGTVPAEGCRDRLGCSFVLQAPPWSQCTWESSVRIGETNYRYSSQRCFLYLYPHGAKN